VEIRDATAEDRTAVIALWEACGLTRPWNVPAADVDRALAGPMSTVLVGEEAGEIVATAMVGDEGHRGWVYYLAVRPDRQGSGLGRVLMASCEAWLRARGCPKIQLMVREGNEAALGFYDAIGYERQEVQVLGRWLRDEQVYLETERLVLRRFTPADVDAVTALDSDPTVMRYITGGRPTPREEIATDYLPWWMAYYVRGERWGFWAAIEKATGDFIGWFHLRPNDEHPDRLDPPDEPELGYRLVRSAWGKGYATEGSRALVRKAFVELGASRVYATTMVVNEGSWRVMEKAGLRYVRTFHMDWPDRIEGEELGDVEYAITREEWERAVHP
jgi:RimJ/RimL family protein N-acetyltransferase